MTQCSAIWVREKPVGDVMSATFESVNVHWRQIILSCKHECKPLVAHQRQPLAIGVVHRVELFQPLRLRLHFLGQVLHRDRAHIDNAVIRVGELVVFRIPETASLPQPLSILIV